jgi:hypothetical protein
VQQGARRGLVPGRQREVGGLLGVTAPLPGLAGLAEVPDELGGRRARAALEGLACPQVQPPALRRAHRLVHRLGGQPVPERHHPRRVLGQQPAVQHLVQRVTGPPGRQPGDRAQGLLVRPAGQHGHRVEHSTRVPAQPAAAFEHAVADRAGNLNLVQVAPHPLALKAGDVGPLVHQPDEFLHRERHTVGALVQERGEGRRDRTVLQHRGHQVGRLGDGQRPQAEPQPGHPADQRGGQPGGEPQQQRVVGDVLGPVGHHDAGACPLGPQEQQEFQRGLVGAMHILDDQQIHAEPGEQFVQRAEKPVPGRGRVVQRLGRGRQVGGPFGEQRPQRPGQPGQPQVPHSPGDLP